MIVEIILKNTDTVSHSWGGTSIPAGSQYTVRDVDRLRLLSDSQFLSDLDASLAVLNINGTDVTPLSGKNALSYNAVATGLSMVTGIISPVFGTTGGTITEGNDDRIFTENVVKVKKNPGAGEFSSIKAAVDSITDATATNRYLIYIGPGVYIEDTITTKPNVFIRGSERATIVKPDAPTKNIFVGVDGASISHMILEGATGSGAAAVFMAGGAANSEFNIHNIIFRSNYHFVKIDSTGGDAAIVIRESEPGLLANTTVPFSVTGTGTGFLRLADFGGTLSSGASISDFIFVSGAGNRVILIDLFLKLEGGTTSTYGLRMNDGAMANVSGAELTGFGTALFVENAGSSPTLEAVGLIILDSVTKDVLVEHPSAVISLNGLWQKSKSTIDENVTASVAHSDTTGDTAQTLIGSLFQGDTENKLVNLSKLTRSGAVLGHISGGDLTNPTGLIIDVATGIGFTRSAADDTVREVNWNATTLTIPQNTDRFITVNANGLIQTEASVLDNLKERISLGRVVSHDDHFIYVKQSKTTMVQHGNLIEKYLRKAVGPLYESGSTVTENGVTARSLDVTSGTYFYGSKEFSPSGGILISWDAFFKDGVGGFTHVAQSQVDNANFDDGSGTLAPLTASWFAKHVLYVTGDGAEARYLLTYAQEQHSTLVESEDAILANPPSFISGGVSPIATIIVQQGVANIIKIQDIRPIISFRAPGSAASSDHGNLLGLTDDDHQQYLLTDGNRAMSGDLNMGLNAITGVTTVNNVVVQSHASRHLPNGADPLSTNGPVNIGTLNATGIQNSFSRSDHSHQGVHALKSNTGVNRFGDLSLQNGTGIFVDDNGDNSFTVRTTFGLPLKFKAGTVAALSFTGSPRKAAVTFSTAFADSNYTITITGEDGRSFSYESKSATGFTINTNAAAALSGEVSWQAIKNGES